MALSSWSVQEAKNHFSRVVAAARREPQVVTKHGKPAVVVVAAEEYARLSHFDDLHKPSFAEHLLAMPSDGGSFQPLDGELRDFDS